MAWWSEVRILQVWFCPPSSVLRSRPPRDRAAFGKYQLDILKAISMALDMKTTLIIEDTILKKAKEQAAARDTTVSELVNQSLRSYLHASPANAGEVRTFSMPVFGHAARSTTGVTPAQMAELRDDGR